MSTQRHGLFGLPPLTRSLILGFAGIAAASSGWQLSTGQPVQFRHVALFACAVGATFLTAVWTRLQRDLDRGAIPCAHGSWIFALLLTGCSTYLPLAVIGMHTAEWLVVERGQVPWFKAFANTSTTLVACAAAAAVPWWPLSLVTFLVMNNMLVGALAASAGGTIALHRMLDPRMQAVAIGMCLPGLPLGLMSEHLWLIAPAILPVIALAHWTTLRMQCDAPAREATGAIAEETWVVMVRTWLPSLSAGAVVVVLCDPTAEIHGLLRHDVRPEDLIGETGEGFVIFQPLVGNITGAAASVSTRLRSVLKGHQVGIGYAVKPDNGTDVHELLAAAAAHAVVDLSYRTAAATKPHAA